MPAKLHGKLANLIGDVDPRTFRVTETFKKLTGQDEITAEHKHGQPFTFTSRALIIAGFNETPHASDTTAGFFERWITIPFVQYYPDEVADKELDGKLQAPAELQGLLVQAAAGLRRLMERGHFEQPELVRQATTGFRQKADRVRSFVRENTSYGKDAWTERKDVYAAYKSWADDGDGRKPLSSAKFYERLPPAVADVLGQQTRITTKNGARGFDGLKLAEPPEPEAAKDTANLLGLLDYPPA
jgi:putative DNA primase/helicase